jgi:hypothetical protein
MADFGKLRKRAFKEAIMTELVTWLSGRLEYSSFLESRNPSLLDPTRTPAHFKALLF